tara:strand:+ start:1149 stop:1886 length:738 start_codon:yes stop_codon:yes gene_type:complete
MVKTKISNLHKRIASSLLAIPLILFILYDTSGVGLLSLIAVLAILSIYELSSISNTSFVLGGVFHFAVLFSLFLIPLYFNFIFLVFVWGGLVYEIASHPRRRVCFWLYNIILAYTWYFVFQIDSLGGIFLVQALLLIWSVDSLAFLGGRWIGHTPLLKSVSPNKTLEGALCGLAVGLIWPFMFFKGGLVALACVIGDLVESRLKRLVKCKDSGYFLPGHGGVLDRIDSVAAGLPLYFFFLSIGVN